MMAFEFLIPAKWVNWAGNWFTWTDVSPCCSKKIFWYAILACTITKKSTVINFRSCIKKDQGHMRRRLSPALSTLLWKKGRLKWLVTLRLLSSQVNDYKISFDKRPTLVTEIILEGENFTPMEVVINFSTNATSVLSKLCAPLRIKQQQCQQQQKSLSCLKTKHNKTVFAK